MSVSNLLGNNKPIHQNIHTHVSVGNNNIQYEDNEKLARLICLSNFEDIH